MAYRKVLEFPVQFLRTKSIDVSVFDEDLQRLVDDLHDTLNVEGGVDPEMSRLNQVIDRVNTTGSVWLGSTIECSQCHNHKYDPFSQKEYY